MSIVRSIYYDCNTNAFTGMLNSNIDIYKLMSTKDILTYKQKGGTYYTRPNSLNVVYEIVFPILDDKLILRYDSESNMMFDEDDNVIYNIFRFISPIMFSIFKEKKDRMVITGINNEVVELLYIWERYGERVEQFVD